MTLSTSNLALSALLALAFASSPAGAQSRMIGGNPGPEHNYVCPNADGGPPLDCYFDAVRHLYTMCRHVKSIEIIEFGYEKSDEGINNAKSNACVEKQKGNIAAPYREALKAARSKQASDGVKSLQEYWLASLGDLRWRKGESPEQYLARTSAPFADFDKRSTMIAQNLPPPDTKIAKAAPKAAPARATTASKPATPKSSTAAATPSAGASTSTPAPKAATAAPKASTGTPPADKEKARSN